MSELEQALNTLKSALNKHESVEEFKLAQAKIKELPDLALLSGKMKAFQQEAVLYDKIGKPKAASQSANQADQLEHRLSDLPIVADYREKLQDASDLLQYVTKSIEEKVNEELTHGQG